MDDCFASFDSQVSNSIFHNLIEKELEGKTRILATNSLHFTTNCKHILVLKGGRIVEEGEFNEL